MDNKELSLDEVFGSPSTESNKPKELSLDEVFGGKEGSGFISGVVDTVKGAGQEIAADPSQAALAGGSAAAESGLSLAAGHYGSQALGAVNKVAGKLASRIPIVGPAIAPLVPSALGMAEFAGISALAHGGVKKGEEAIGVGKAIEDAQSANPNISTAAGTAVMAPMAAKSLKGYGQMVKNEGLKTAVKTAVGSALGGAAFPYIDYGTRKGINAVGGDDTVADIPLPTGGEVARSARDMAILGGMGYKAPAKGREKTAPPAVDQTEETATPEDVIPKTDAEQQALDEQISQTLLDAEAPLTAAAVLEKPPVAKSKEVAPAAETAQQPVAENVTVTPEEQAGEGQASETIPSSVPNQQMELPLTEAPKASDPNQIEFNFDPANEPQVSDATAPQDQQAPQMPTRQQFADAGKALGELAANRPDSRTEFPVGVSAPEATRDPNQLAAAFENVAGTPEETALPEMSAQDAALSMSKEQFRSWAAQRGTKLPVDQIDAFHDKLNPQAKNSGNPFDVLAGVGTPESPEVVEPFAREEPLASGYRFMFTTSTDRDTVIDNLVKTGQDGEIRNLNRLMILHGLSDLKGVKVSIEDAQGNYQGDREVSSITSVKVKNPEDLKKVRGRFADIAKISKQKEFLEEKVGEGDASQLDKMDADGFTHVTKSIITIEGLTADQIEQARRASGLLGYTLAKNRIEIYDRDANAAQYQPKLAKFIETLHDLGGIAPELTTDVAAIRGYSEDPAEYKGTVGYDDPSLFLPDAKGRAERLENPLVKRIFGLMGRAIEPPKGSRRSYFDKSDLTKKQVAKQSEIAQQYEKLPDNDLANPLVSEAYRRLNEEILKQYDYLTQDGPEGPGMKFYAQDWEVSGEPYKNSAEVVKDIRTANRMKFLKTSPSAFGPEGVDFSAHPMLEMADRVDANGVPLNYNDLFRAVHDAIAHGLFSVEFGPVGEESAWQTHIRTLNDPMARWALTSETRGQNSWVNYRTQFLGKDGMPLRKGDKGYVPLKDRGFARQKAALLPLESVLTGDKKVDEPVIELQKRLGAEASKGSVAENSQVSDAAPKGKAYSERGVVGISIESLLPHREQIRGVGSVLEKGNDFSDVNEIAESLRKEGFNEPLTFTYDPASGKGMLTDGNHRIVAAQRAGLGEVPVRLNIARAKYLDRPEYKASQIAKPGTEIASVKDLKNALDSAPVQPETPAPVSTPDQYQVTVKRAPEFSTYGLYNVTIGKHTFQIYRDSESGYWRDASKDGGKHSHFAGILSTENRAEAIERLKQQAMKLDAENEQPETPVAESQGTTVAEQQVPAIPAEKPSQRLIAASLGISPSRIKAYAARLGRPFESIDEAKAYHAEWEKTKASKTAEDRRAEQGAALTLSELIDQSVAKAKTYVDQLKGAKLKKYQDLMIQAEEEVNKDFGDSGTDRVVRGKLGMLNAAHREVVRQLALNKFSEDLAGFLVGAKKKNPEVVGIGNYLRANVNGKPTGTIPSSVAKVFDVLEKSGWKGEGKYSEANSTKSATEESSSNSPQEIQARFAPQESTEETVGIDREQGVSDADVLRMAQDKVLSSDTPLEDRVLGAALLVRDGSPSPEDVQQIQQMFKAIAEMKGGPEAIRKAQARVHDTTLREFATGEDWETLRSRIGEGEAPQTEEAPKVSETYSGRELINRALALTKENTLERKLAEILSEAKALDDINVENWTGLKDQAFGEYVPGKRTIRINASRLQGNTADARTALHEIIHGLTHAFFDKGNAKFLNDRQKIAVKNINDLFKAAKAEAIRQGLTSEDSIAAFSKNGTELPADASSHYGWTSVHEFMTEAMTNKDFQAILKQIQVKDKTVSKLRPKSAWDVFKNAVRKLLGMPKADNSALSHAIDNILDLTQSDQKVAVTGYKNAAINLLPEEQESLNYITAKKFVDLFDTLPSTAEMASVALGGGVKKGWYRQSAKALVDIFGTDSPRFAALLAATSPRTSVESNLINTLNIWKNWTAAGRPTDRKSIVKIMGDSVMGNKGEDSVLNSWINNSMRALTHDRPEDVVLSGPKVNSFARNLRDQVHEVTNDAWMANYARIDQELFSGALNADGSDPGKGWGYKAMSARVRAAAKLLTKETGETWTPAEVQETVWSWAKTLYESQKSGRNALEILRSGELTDEAIAGTPDFATLLNNGKYRSILEDAGYGKTLDELASGRDAANAQGTAKPAAPRETGPLAQEAARKYQERSARRLAELKQERDEAKAAGKEVEDEEILASRTQPTTAFEEPVKKFSKDLQEAVKDTSYLPFTWKGDAGHVSKWINDQAANGATWESVTLDLTSDAPVAGISERQKMVGKVVLTKSLDQKASELKRAGKVAEAARYQKVARTLFESAKMDASLYGQGLNAVKMLSELISGNTVRGQYVDPIAKIHADKLAGREEVADVLGTVKQGREDGAAATVEKAAKIVEKMAGAEGDPEAIKQVIKDALLNPDSTKESLAAELAEATGLPVEKVTPAAEAISQTFSSEARKAVKAQLEKLVKDAEKKEANPKVKKIVESDTDKLLRLMGIGGFSEEKYYNAIAKSFDLPSWDPVFAKSLEVQGEKIAALPESMKDYRQQRTQKLMGEIAKKVRAEKLNNKDVGEIADLMTTFWQLGVLSGPPTQVVNAVASNASIVSESLVEGLGAAMKTGDVRYVTDVLHGFLQAVTGKGGAQGIVGQEFARAFKEGTSKFKNSKGETLSAMETLPDAKDLNGLMKAVSVYGNKLKYVGRSMAAFDAANMAMAERAAEMKAARYYLQSRKGLSGKELSAAMRDLFNPDQGTVDKFRAQAQDEAAKGYYEGEDAASQKRWIERRVNELLSQRRDQLTGGGISEQAIQAAERFTYNDDPRGILGQFASWMNQLNQETKISKFVVSFMKTMMNLVNQTIDWSPYGFLRGANKSFSQIRFKEGSRFDPYRYEEGSPEQYAQYARAAIGTLAWAGLAYLAYKGLEDEQNGKAPAFSIHGAGPSNPYDRQQLIATRNWQPNSIRIGDHWVRYTDWPVLGIALGGMGSFFDSQRYAKNDSTTQEKLFAGAMATASTVLDKNMLQGVSNLFDGIRQTNSPAQQANALKRLVSGSVSGFTNPGFAKWARNSFYADKDGMVNRLDQSTNEGWMYSMIPFSAGYDTPALNTLGEPLQMPWYSSTMWRFADISGVPPHEIITPIVKAGMMLPNPSKSTEFHFVDSTGETQKSRVGKYPGINRRFVELRGQAMKEILTPDVIADLVEMAKENVTDAQAELDSKIGGMARKVAIAQIEDELEEGKLRLE